MKKALSLVLASALAVSMSTMASAKVSVAVMQGPYNVPAVESSLGNAIPGGKYDQAITTKTYTIPTSGTANSTDASAYLLVNFTGGQAPSASDGITKAEMSNAKATLKTRISKGSAAIDNVDVIYDTAADARFKIAKNIRLEMIKPFMFNNTDGLDFEVTAYFMVDGKSYLDQGITFTGTLKNRFSDEDVDKDTTYFDMSDGTIMKPAELVKSMEFYLGNDVSLFGRALKGVKYYGVATTKTTAADDDNILKYDLDAVYHIKSPNLSSVTSYVTIAAADSTHYIYDGEMKYLGRGNDRLPFSDTYYLSSKELDTDTTEVEPDEEESTEEEIDAPNPGTGADDSYPTNVNDNPGTGR